MKQFYFTLLFCCVSFFAYTQVSEHFTDNNFTQNPEWVGDDSLFNVISGELRLNGSVGSEAHLVTSHRLSDSTVWFFRCRFLLNPSNQNFSRFYLTSDHQNLEGPLNGYYVQLGGATGALDSISLYKQSGTERIKIIPGRPATVSKQQNNVAIKVFRDGAGNWMLYSDTSGGQVYTHEGSARDTQFVSGSYLGWFVRYTQGNNQRFFLDDVLAYMPVADTIPPVIDSIAITGNNNIIVYFNESIDTVSLANAMNYELRPSAKNPSRFDIINGKAVQLFFLDSFISGTVYQLRVANVKDENGNAITALSFPFTFYQSALHDLVISEFMADPSPVVMLPEQEFVELYNRTPVPINVKGYALSDGSSTAIFPDATIPSEGFAIVCAASNNLLFTPYGKTIAVSNMPSLNNTSDALILKDPNGKLVHRIDYDIDWYHHPLKKDGGWSIELNYPNQLCRKEAVYSASSDPRGGTPGKANSLWSTNKDTTAPSIVAATVTGAQQLLIVFNEPLNALLSSDITIQPAVSIDSFYFAGTDSIYIQLQNVLISNTAYVISIKHAGDCSGNISPVAAPFTYFAPEPAHNFDVLIHEIMADPEPAQQLPDAEYVELYNRSSKIVSLKGWAIEDAGSSATLPDILLFPDSFLVLTSAAAVGLFRSKVYGLAGFPLLGNDGDVLVLRNANGQVMHSVHYTSAWYNNAFKKAGGWSLEMIDVQNPCGADNWKASEDRNGGTPGLPNSVRGSNKDKKPPRLIRAYPIDHNRLQLYFNEAIDSSTIKPMRFLLDESVYPDTLYGNAPAYISTTLQFATPFSFGKDYSIMITDSLADCAGNLMEDYRSITFTMPYEADSSSLVINEVLFNARTDAYDFVELYNKSSNAVDLKTLIIGRGAYDGTLTELVHIAPGGFVLRPGEYAALTSDPADLARQYYCKNREQIVPVDLPSYTDNEGTVVLMNNTGQVFDEFNYDKDMHFPLLDNQDGVSLERIDYHRNTKDRTNWTSASASAGYATPTYENSQYLGARKSNEMLMLQPAVISPDDDGYQDIMNLNYTLNEPGFTGSLMIYDAAGKLVKKLFRNEVLGITGTYTWNGTQDDGSIAPAGIYLFYFEVFTLNGVVKKETAVGVVAKKL
jgi:hypothetical protein